MAVSYTHLDVYKRQTYKVWKGTEAEIMDAFLPHFGTSFFRFEGGVMNTVFLILFAFLTFFLFLSYNDIRKKKHIQAQKKVDILYLSLITSILVMVCLLYTSRCV